MTIESDFFSNFIRPFNECNIILVLLFFTALIAIYSIFIYYFYRFLAKKNIIDLNLSQYNRYEHPVAMKFFAFLLYILEYIIILPIITLFWFGVLSIFLLLLAKNLELRTILIISASLVASVRVTSYLSQKLSQDLAKMLPFTLLALALTSPNFFSIELFLARLTQMPLLISEIPYYLLFIVVVEFIMRITDLIRRLFKFEETN